jgi:hypothetical protein
VGGIGDATVDLCDPHHTPKIYGKVGNVWAFADQRAGDFFND